MAHTARSIERVPALLIGLLDEAGKLPALPPHIERLGNAKRPRKVTLQEVEALTWLAEWTGPKVTSTGFVAPVGIVAYRDVYDYHTSSDVREIVHIAGTGRSVRSLLEHVIASGRNEKRRCIGSIDLDNLQMAAFLHTLEGVMITRVVFEDAGE